MKLCPKDSVGMIARNRYWEYLMLERLRHPAGLACVAGHLDIIDNEKELPLHGAFREWQEETGSVARNMKLLFQKEFSNPCKDGSDGHLWYVYQVLDWSGEPKLIEKEKHGFVRWMSIAEIQEWVKSGKPVDPAWFAFIFPKLGLLSTVAKK